MSYIWFSGIDLQSYIAFCCHDTLVSFNPEQFLNFAFYNLDTC